MDRRQALAAVLAVAAFLATSLVYRGVRAASVDFERGFEASFVEGFHPRERAEGRYFRWTDGESFVVLRHLPRRGELSVEARLRTIRPAGVPLPELAFTANGVTVLRSRAEAGTASYRFDVPSRGGTLRLGIESEIFEASGGRRLGVQVLAIDVVSRAGGAWLGPALAMSAAAVLFFLAGTVAGLSPLAAAGGALGLEAAFVYLLGRGAVAFSGYPREVALLAAASFGLAALLRFVFDRLDWLHPVERSWVVGALVLLFALELGVATYPLTLSSDADFQANRMSELLRGDWHPTSVTQHDPPFRIPYPASLFVTAAPLVKLGLDRVTALELVTGVFDVLVSGLLVFLAWRFFDDLRAGLLAAFLYQLVPMNPLSFSAGNFTNVFGASVLALGLTALVAAVSDGNRRLAAVAALAALVSLTAHFGVLLEGAVLWPAWLAGLWLLPVPVKDVRRFATLAISSSFVVAAIYYLGYWDLVASQWSRAVSGGGEGSGDGALGAELALAGDQLGWVFLVTAFLGSVSFLRRPTDGPFQLSATVWTAVTALFLAVALVSPVEIRYWLQALPLLALASGLYLSRAFDRGRVGRLSALAAVVYIAAIGLHQLYEVALVRYH